MQGGWRLAADYLGPEKMKNVKFTRSSDDLSENMIKFATFATIGHYWGHYHLVELEASQLVGVQGPLPCCQ